MNEETNIHELLTRYMDGNCTQEELRQLKEYFGSTKDLPADLRPYAQMFDILSERQPTPPAEALDRFAEAAPSPLPLWGSASVSQDKEPSMAMRHSPKGGAGSGLFLLAAACIAAFAVILLAPPQQKEENMAIAYVDGKMIGDKALAMQIGQEALQEIFSAGGNEEQQLNELFNTP